MDIVDGSGLWVTGGGGIVPLPVPAPTPSGGGGRLRESPIWEVPLKPGMVIDDDDEIIVIIH